MVIIVVVSISIALIQLNLFINSGNIVFYLLFAVFYVCQYSVTDIQQIFQRKRTLIPFRIQILLYTFYNILCLFLQQLIIALILIITFHSLFIAESTFISIRTDTFKESQRFRIYRFSIIIRIAISNITPEILYLTAISICIEYFFFQHQMTIIQQPVAQVLVIDIQFTIILTNRFLYKPEIILEIIILHLPQNTLTYGISDMFQNSFFRIDDAFNTKCIDCFRTSTLLICSFRLLAILYTEVIDILQTERA